MHLFPTTTIFVRLPDLKNFFPSLIIIHLFPPEYELKIFSIPDYHTFISTRIWIKNCFHPWLSYIYFHQNMN